MKFPKNIKRFTREEDGSLLVFFCISIITILGIFALSFDMGRRASTQTDMQSFADNVALAAAGELDGSANAIVNAQAAATSVIIAANENLKAGTGGGNGAITFDVNTDLVFYTDLPDQDRPGTFDPNALGDDTNANYKYRLPTTNVTTVPQAARFVGVTLDTTDVDWLFAGVVSTNVPDAAVGALAIAGNAGYTCEIAPLMFCLPRDASGNVEELTPGIAVQLQTVGNGAAWNPGQFGYLDVGSIPDSVSGTCAGETPESRFQACLLALGISACFQDSGVDIQTGQRGGQEPSGFNLPFGIFGQAMTNLRNNSIYATGPHTISGVNSGSGNGNGNGGGPNNCRAGSESPDTMAFPSDTCHPNCVDGSGNPTRYGNGIWDRATYVDTNYSIPDPADPTNSSADIFPGSWFDFPQANLSRYQYYLLEIARAANGGAMVPTPDAVYNNAVYAEGGNEPGNGVPVNQANYDSWDDFWDDSPSGFNPIIPDAHNRVDNGLPQCSQVSPTANSDRRVVVVAGIDCPPGALNGDEDDVPVEQYYEVFLLAPARDGVNDAEGPNGNTNNSSPQFELYVEIIQPIGGEGGGSTTVDTAFREIVQLYR